MPFLSERFLDACPARYIPSECRLVWKLITFGSLGICHNFYGLSTYHIGHMGLFGAFVL